MRWTALLTLALGCAGTTTATPKPAAPALDDAAAIARAHAFFESVDGRHAEAFAAMVGAGFFLFEDGYTINADKLSAEWSKPRPARERSCTDEKVRRGDGVIVYVGDCKEHQPAHGERPAQDWQGWNTVVLAPEGGAWKVALWQWTRSGIEAERIRWNEAYRRKTSYTAEPNRLLVSTVAGLEPGIALDVAMGQGRNALYLASQGWQVTGVDISDEGIRAAEKTAAERGLALETVQADLNGYDFGTARWDLVTMIYAGGDMGWIERIKPSIKPGGLFILEFFLKDPGASAGGAFVGLEAGQLAPVFSGWDILRDEVVEDIADWGQSKANLVRFVARKR